MQHSVILGSKVVVSTILLSNKSFSLWEFVDSGASEM